MIMTLVPAGVALADGPPAIAQRGGGGGGSGGMHCNQDIDCHQRLPPPRVCPGGGTSTATACCRMNYCGICWSDCPGH